MFKIMIDSGHIGPTYNAGAVRGYYESAIVWALHKKLVTELKKYDCQVDVTRPSINTNMDVYPRGTKAKGYNLFLSLHTNWCGTESVNRTDVYVPKENTGEPKAFGLLLAKAIKKACGTTAAKTAIRKNSSGGEWYGVMRGADNVGCRFYYIVEHGFHSNESFCHWMMDNDNLAKLAKAEAQCIASYFGLKTKSGNDTSGDNKADKGSDNYKVKVSVSDLNVRKGPGTNYATTGKFTGKGIFTIVETKTGAGSKSGWGRLKSGVGWISLDYAKKV